MKLHETPFLTSDLLMARVKQRDFKAKGLAPPRRSDSQGARRSCLSDKMIGLPSWSLFPESGAMLQYALSNTALWHLDTLKNQGLSTSVLFRFRTSWTNAAWCWSPMYELLKA